MGKGGGGHTILLRERENWEGGEGVCVRMTWWCPGGEIDIVSNENVPCGSGGAVPRISGRPESTIKHDDCYPSS